MSISRTARVAAAARSRRQGRSYQTLELSSEGRDHVERRPIVESVQREQHQRHELGPESTPEGLVGAQAPAAPRDQAQIDDLGPAEGYRLAHV
jgi:hypothetical protein